MGVGLRSYSCVQWAGHEEAGQAGGLDSEAVRGSVRLRGLQDHRSAPQGFAEQADAQRKRKLLFQLNHVGLDAAAVADIEGPAREEQG